MSKLFKLRRRSSVSCFQDVEYNVIVEVQERLKAIYENDKSLFDENDFENIDVKRFVLRYIRKQNFDVGKSVEMVKRALIWMKEKNFAHIDYNCYPREYYEIGGIVIEHGTDIDGNIVVYLRSKLLVITHETKEFYERLFAIYCNEAIKKAVLKNKGIVTVVDNSDVSLENINISFCLNMLKLLINYMPDALRLILAYNLPWFAKSPFKILLKAMPSDLCKILTIVGPNDLHKYITESNLPNFIKNSREKYDGYDKILEDDFKDLDSIDCEVIGIRSADKEKFRDLCKRLQRKLDQ